MILKKGDQYFYATTKSRHVDPSTLDPTPIPTSRIWPPFRPNLLDYGDTEASSDIASMVLHEAKKCEILSALPPPLTLPFHVVEYSLAGAGLVRRPPYVYMKPLALRLVFYLNAMTPLWPSRRMAASRSSSALYLATVL